MDPGRGIVDYCHCKIRKSHRNLQFPWGSGDFFLAHLCDFSSTRGARELTNFPPPPKGHETVGFTFTACFEAVAFQALFVATLVVVV